MPCSFSYLDLSTESLDLSLASSTCGSQETATGVGYATKGVRYNMGDVVMESEQKAQERGKVQGVW